jgi:hypothetical protein
MWQPTNAQWWCLAIVALFIVAAWPPRDDRSLATKVVNWAVDPFDELPILPPQLGPGVGDDLEAVNARDAIVRRYDELYTEGGWTRQRLLLKGAGDPLRPSTTRQLLAGFGVVTVLLIWRSAVRTRN